MARYLVTGGAGFIGSHLVAGLLTRGHRVRILDDFSTGTQANIAAAQAEGGGEPEVEDGDVRDPAVARVSVQGCDGVFHLAALGSVPRSVAHPLDTHEVNATGTLNLLVAARDAGVSRFVLAGSSSVYGALQSLPKREDHPTAPISPYGVSKLAAEHYVRIFAELYGLSTVTLRYYNVFGPRQDPRSEYAAVIPRFIHRMLRGEPPEIHGDGDQSRDFTYVGDVVEANLLTMRAPADRIRSGLFNVAGGARHSVNELVGHLARLIGGDTPSPIHEAARAGDIRHSQADITRIRERLGFEPGISFAEGLQRTVRYFQETAGG